MTDFYELDAPREDFSILTKWYVAATTSGNHFLCNDGSGVARVGNTIDIFYFNDEIHAHVCANKYYQDAGRIYPYQNEWSVALNNLIPEPATLNKNESQSQTMEFI